MKNLGLIGNIKKKKTISVCENLIKWAAEEKISFAIDEPLATILKNENIPVETHSYDVLQSDAIVVLGGDGTILSVARRLSGRSIPVLAVNTGSLGFLSQFSIREIKPMITKILADDFVFEKRMMIQVHLVRKKEEILKSVCLNDIVITKEALSRIINLAVFVDGHYTTSYRADGVIVSTPTGSTAHCLSAGGPIVHPEMHAMITLPICPHTLSNRPIVLPSTSTIEIVVSESRDREGAILTIDGQEAHTLQGDDSVIITKFPKYFHLIAKPNSDYYSLLRTKLKWGGRISYQ